jgi:hypothetical protein
VVISVDANKAYDPEQVGHFAFQQKHGSSIPYRIFSAFFRLKTAGMSWKGRDKVGKRLFSDKFPPVPEAGTFVLGSP